MEMSFAQALNEAKQVIVQQSNRIRTDADKIRQQQQTIVDQCSIITEHEMKNKEQAGAIARQAENVAALEGQVSNLTVAREQAEAVIDRQGQRLSNLQEQVGILEKKTGEQSETIERITAEHEAVKAQVPSSEDAAALAEMASLLTTKKAPSGKESGQNGSLRLNTEPRAEAA